MDNEILERLLNLLIEHEQTIQKTIKRLEEYLQKEKDDDIPDIMW